MSVRLMEGVIAAAMPTWAPGQFIQRPEDGSWWRGGNTGNMNQSYLGTGSPVGHNDYVPYWRDELDSRILIQPTNTFRPCWNEFENAVEFIKSNNSDPRNLYCYLPDGYLASDCDITIMATLKVAGNEPGTAPGAARCVVGIADFYPGASDTYVNIAPKATTTQAWTMVNQYSTEPNKRLTGSFSADTYATFSVTRSKVAGSKLQNFYINGVLVASGPSVHAGGTASTNNRIYIFGPYDEPYYDPKMHVRDLIVAFKKANTTDHVGYYQYAVANGLI